MDISTLAALVNAETVNALSSIDSIKSEKINGEILNTENTNKKIEERRRSITAESQSSSSGLKSTTTYHNPTTVRGSEPQKSYSSGYTYQNSYTYGRQQPTIESKAREYSNYVFKKAVESSKKEEKKDNWNMFELDEKEKMKNKKIKPVNKKYDKAKIILLQAGAAFLKTVIEDIYISLNKK